MPSGLRVALLTCLLACGQTTPPPVATAPRALPAPTATATAPEDTDHRIAELYRQGCEEGSGDGCNWLGLAYHTGEHGLKKDTELAFDYYVKACNAGNLAGCSNLANELLDVDPAHRDLARARAAGQKACSLGGARGCTLAGTAAFLQNDDAAAFAFATSGCDRDDALGCALLGRMHLEGRGTKKDAARALELYTRACNANTAAGCFMAGRLYFNGEGTAKDTAHGTTLYARACDLDDSTACNDLGIAYWNGTGVTKDLARAKALLEKACKMHEGAACTNLATLLQSP